MRKIIISGASGFIGSSFIKRLLQEDVHIWALDRCFRDSVLPISPKLTRIEEISDIKKLKVMLRNTEYDLFYNFAWQGVNGPDKAKYEIQINNIMLTLRYAELAHVLGCKKYLCAGTIAERAIDSLPTLQNVSGNMMYSAAKNCSHTLLEVYCKNINMEFIWMQFSNIYGPNNKTGNLISYTIEQLKRNEPACFGPAQQPYDFLYVDDLIEAIYRLGMNNVKNGFYYVGSGQPRILAEYLKVIGEIYGRSDLIRIGERADDGIKYDFSMMDSTDTISALGNYVSGTFESHIQYTIDNY